MLLSLLFIAQVSAQDLCAVKVASLPPASSNFTLFQLRCRTCQGSDLVTNSSGCVYCEGMCLNPALFDNEPILCESKRGENMKRIDCYNDTNQFGMTDQLVTPPPGYVEPTTTTACLEAEGVVCGSSQTEETRSFSPGPTFPPSGTSAIAAPSTATTIAGVPPTVPSGAYSPVNTGPTNAAGMQPCGQSASGQLYYKDKCGVCGGTGTKCGASSISLSIAAILVVLATLLM